MEAFEKVDVLKKLVEIFQKLNQGEDISGELSLLRQQCDKYKFITEGKLRRIKSTGDIVLRVCEFSKLQFPKSQIERSGPNIRVK
jgi:hypothetical protein